MKNLKDLFSRIIILGVFPLLGLVACGKNNSGSSNSNYQPSYQSCVVGQVAPAGYMCINGQLIPTGGGVGSLLNNVEFNASYMNGTMSISAQGGSYGGSAGGYGMGDSKAIIYYNGPISVQGTMTVDSSLCTSGTMYPVAGTYTLTGTGMITSGRISQLNLTAAGAANLSIQATAVVYNPTGLERDAMGNKISLSGTVLLNGMSCGVIYTY